MKNKKQIINLIEILKKIYPIAECFLNFKKPHELLIAARLSAQFTDKKVNTVTKKLFQKFNSIEEFANAKFDEIYEIIKPCGLGNKKANDVIASCQHLKKFYDNKIPDNMTELLTLPGVGRKTANLILATLFNKPTIIVDTHVKRISTRLGLTKKNNPEKIEFELLKLIPKNESIKFCHRLVQFGRDFCKAKNPNCKNCPLTQFCENIFN